MTDANKDDDVPNATAAIINDASTLWNGTLSLRAFWYDMRGRQRTWAHQATLLLGLLEIAAAVAFCISLHFYHAQVDHEGELCLDQMTLVLGVAGLSQGFLTANGICVENAAMLLVANLNGFYILGYFALHLKVTMISSLVDSIVVGIFALFSLLHLTFSLVAWGGKFRRFIFFRVGLCEQTVRNYRIYELLLASLVLDLVVTITTCGNLFFMVGGAWWQFLILGIFICLACVSQVSVRTAVRHERTWLAAIALGTQALLVAACALALWYHQFMEVTISTSCKEAPVIMFGIMTSTHVFSAIVFLCCATFFGEGMKTVFANEKAAIDFVNENYERHVALAATLLD